MKRISFDVPRWHVFLHRDARGLGSVDADDAPVLKLQDEVFERLFSGAVERLPESERDSDLADWAEALHAQCDQLPSFERLSNEVRGDSFAAAFAVETIMDELGPYLSSREPPSPSSLRRAAGRGCERASSAVGEMRESLEGMAGVSWGVGAGNGATGDGNNAKDALLRIRSDPRLQRIALLAGRFKRIARGRLHQRVRHGVDEVCDIETGNSLDRLLPVELGRLLNPRRRLSFLRDWVERSCLQYQMRGPERLGRGPLIVCLDKSGSMDGPPDIWSTAVALALLEIAQRERRPFTLLAFNGAVKFEATVAPGDGLPRHALFVSCNGGTDIAGVLHRGLELIASGTGPMKKSDIVLVTDGQSDSGSAEEIRARSLALDAAILGVAIGMPKDSLAPWCDEVQAVSNLDTIDGATADALFNQ